jgi:hypothetical protein
MMGAACSESAEESLRSSFLIVWSEMKTARKAQWVTAKGYVRKKPKPCLKPGVEVIKDPLPDQSWLDTPMPRRKFYQWVLDAAGNKT